MQVRRALTRGKTQQVVNLYGHDTELNRKTFQRENQEEKRGVLLDNLTKLACLICSDAGKLKPGDATKMIACEANWRQRLCIVGLRLDCTRGYVGRREFSCRMIAVTVFVEACNHKACVRLPAYLIFQHVAELKRLALLYELTAFLFAQALKIRVRQSVSDLKHAFFSKAIVEDEEDGIKKTCEQHTSMTQHAKRLTPNWSNVWNE